ncbi:GntR family transcriptional regulator [Pseudonocardia adelaidensis]|uniref:GntR family transcriptional regulator n=1 Tax=Pseudonocardia adelaidensis TaxID=648754 RepID=A0ABP9NGV2_9PSEU
MGARGPGPGDWSFESTSAGKGRTSSVAIAQALQRRILTGEIAVGSWLRHEALAAEFGISRTPIREALHVLQARGIVTIVRNRGARVNGHSSRDIRELGEVRSELEGFAAQLAAERITDEQLEQLRGSWRGFRDAIEEFVQKPSQERDAETAARWVAANDEFHNLILEASGNRQLRVSIQEIHHRLPPNSSYLAYSGRERLLRQNLAEHDKIAEAIGRNDGATARRLMTAHIRRAVMATVDWMEGKGLLRDGAEPDEPLAR